MRITAVRAWFNLAVHRGVGAARRASRALTKRIRGDGHGIARGVGVGDDESQFGGQGGRVWFEWMEEARERLIELFEHSVFERVPGLQRFVRRFLGRPAVKRAPPPPRPKVTGPLGAHVPEVDAADQALVRRRMLDAHVGEHAGLRDRIDQARKSGESGHS